MFRELATSFMSSVPFAAMAIFVIGLSVFQAVQTYRVTQGDLLQRIYFVLFGYLSVYVLALSAAVPTIHELDYNVAIWAYLLPCVGITFLLMGYRQGINVFTRVSVSLSRRTVFPKRLIVLGLFFALLGMAGELYFITSSGGYEVYFSRGRGLGNYQDSTGYIYGARWLLAPGIGMLLGAATRIRSKVLAGIIFALLTVGAGYNLFLGQRTGIFVFFLMFLGYLRVILRRAPSLTTVIAFLLVAATLMGFVKSHRNEFYIGSDFENTRQALESPVETALSSLSGNFIQGDSSDFDARSVTIEVLLYLKYINIIPDKVDFDYGMFYANYFFAWIPHLVWKDRPDLRADERDQIIATIGTSHLSGPTPTMLGFFWMNGGLFGVVVLSLITGAFYAFFDAFSRFDPYRHPIATAIFLSTLGQGASTAIGLGPMASFNDWGPFVVLPIVIMLVFATGPVRRLKAAESSSANAHVPRLDPVKVGP